MNKHTQPQRVRRAIAAAVLLMGAGCASPQSGPSILPASSAVLPSTPFNSNATPAADSRHKLVKLTSADSHNWTVYQTKNNASREIYPLATNGGNCWAPVSPPKPIRPGASGWPIVIEFLPQLCKDYSQTYSVEWGYTFPPTGGCTMVIHYNPDDPAHPYWFTESGDVLTCKLSDWVTQGAIQINDFTVNSPSN